MNDVIEYHSRQITKKDIGFIRALIAQHTDKSRWYISREICRQWDWRQANGALKDMVCRGLLLKLESDGLITLPPRKRIINNPFLDRKPPKRKEVDQSPIIGNLRTIQPIELRYVGKSPYEGLYNSLIHEHHYLGYTYPIGEKLKYIAFSNGRPIACIGWTSAVWHIGCRDRFIGWTAEIRKKNLHLIAYQKRFLILPWVYISCLASHLLGRMAKVLSMDWQRVYNHPIYFLETFVDRQYKATCYRAANWIYLGKTTGRGKNDQTHKPNRSIKAVWGYPLLKNFRQVLQHG